jgi:predicted RNA-binding protein with PIN domain
MRAFALEAVQALGIVAGVVAVGVGTARLAVEGPAYPHAQTIWESGEVETSPEDPGDEDARSSREPRVWLVDGFNVLHAGVLVGRDRAGWWSEARRAELLAIAERFQAEREDAEIWVVFDGPSATEQATSDARRVHVAFARSADEWLVRRVRAAGEPVCVVTSDRQLVDRVRRRGAEILSPRGFLARCGRV